MSFKYKITDEEGNEVQLTEEILPQEIKDNIIKKAQSMVYQNIDSRLAESFGTQKKEGEKTSDYIARMIKEKEDKIKELSEASPDVTKFQADIDKLKSLNEKLKGDLKVKEEEFSKKLFQKDFKAMVNSIDIPVPPHITADEKEAYVNDQRELIENRLSSKYKVKYNNDQVEFFNTDDSPVTDDNLNPLGAKDIVKRDLPYLFKEYKQDPPASQGGQSSKPNQAQGGKYKTFAEISAAAVNEGLAPGSIEYVDRVDKLAEENGINY